jgi:hypothetical protein
MDAPSARAASLARSSALSFLPGRPWAGRLDPYVIPYVNLYVILYAQAWRTPSYPTCLHLSKSSPLRGEWSGQAERCASRD